MSNTEIQQQLERLATQWPGESVAAEVVSQLSDSPIHPVLPSRKIDFRLYSWIGVVATVVVFAASLWISMPRSMQSALQDNLQNASRWYALKEVFDEGETTTGEVWFDRDHGFRLHGMGQVTVDDGKVSHSWSLNSKETTVLKRPSMDGITMTAEMFDVSKIPSDWKKRRSEDLDREVGGVGCRAYVVSIPRQAADNRDQRSVLLLDSSERLRQLISQTRLQDSWQLASRMTIDYEREIPASTFQLDFPADARIVDVQSGLENRFPVNQAVATGEKDGLLFAIHDLVSLDDGSYYVVSSVRGTPDYLTKFPPTRRPLNLNYTALDVVSQLGSHGSVDGGTQVMMYNMEWQGVHYLWWVMTPNDRGTGTPSRLSAQPDNVRIPLVGNHLHKDRRDHRGVQLQTRLALMVPLVGDQKSSLEQVVANARTDMQLVSSALGEFGSLPIAGAADANTVVFTSFDQITDAGYAKELRKARRQTQTGDFSGADPPAGFDRLIAARNESLDQTGQVDPNEQAEVNQSNNKPTALPTTITGRVVDSDDKPISDAKVTVRIRRFRLKKDFDENAGPGPWSAKTDETGGYSISPTGTVLPAMDEVRIKVVADGYAEMSAYDGEKELLQGSLPTVKLLPGRKISGRLVDGKGNPVNSAIVRFQHNSEATVDAWDSGPFAVDRDGKFSLSIPAGGKAAGVAYPKGFSPRFIDVAETSDQGDIPLEQGIRIRGRVLDRNGNGVAGTIVGFRNTQYSEMYGFVAVIGSAVRTDSKGYFQLPPLRGTYKLSVTKSAPDYSRQMMVVGQEPPIIESLEIDIDAADTSELLIMQEAQ